MKITKSRLKEIIMEEISYLEQREINVPGLFNISRRSSTEKCRWHAARIGTRR